MAGAVVLASVNQDMVVTTPRIPAPGETILGTGLFSNRGGKGGNQVVALARLGVPTAVIACVGADTNGTEYLDALTSEGVDISAVKVSQSEPTGAALITVSEAGANSIVVVPGANGEVDAELIESATGRVAEAAVVLAQLEVPLSAVDALFRLARHAGVTTVLNPAPARDYEDLAAILTVTDVLVPNEIEFEQIFGVRPVQGSGEHVVDDDHLVSACQPAFAAGVRWVIVTLGALGAAAISPQSVRYFPPIDVKVVDTTAAGDSFVAGVVAVLARDGSDVSASSVADGCVFGTKVASWAVGRKGAHPSLPTLDEVVGAFG